MEHDLINTIVIGFVAAFIFGLAAKKLRLPSLVGYLVAGVMVGPHTPGFVGNVDLARQLAEIGIILLMFGVGLHFSLSDLQKVWKIAVPGALFQMVVATLLGCAAVLLTGMDIVAGITFGFSLSVASTIVLLRALEQRGELDASTGKVAIGWLIVEDIAMVFVFVLLPVFFMFSDGESFSAALVASEILKVMAKMALFAFLMIYIGRKFLPWLIIAIARTKSREIMTLGTLSIALGFAFVAYSVFDASFALGAFLAGLVLSESEIGRKSAEQSLPMRDAFAVLFFVSVGMLFDPSTLYKQPLMVFVTLAIIVAGKFLAAVVIAKFLRQPRDVQLTVGVSLAQIGEFSFILIGLAVTNNMVPETLYNLVLAGALLSIAINPFLFKVLDAYTGRPAALDTV